MAGIGFCEDGQYLPKLKFVEDAKAEELAKNKYPHSDESFFMTYQTHKLTTDKQQAFVEGYKSRKEEIEKLKTLNKKLFSLWEAMAEVGELSIGKDFSQVYNELKTQIK